MKIKLLAHTPWGALRSRVASSVATVLKREMSPDMQHNQRIYANLAWVTIGISMLPRTGLPNSTPLTRSGLSIPGHDRSTAPFDLAIPARSHTAQHANKSYSDSYL